MSRRVDRAEGGVVGAASGAPGGAGDNSAGAHGRDINTALIAGLSLAAIATIAVLAAAVMSASTVLEAGQAAPDFALETFDGERIRLVDLRGQVVVLNFWASWCETCGDEAALLEQVWRDYRPHGVMVLGVDYTDTRPAALEYLRRHGVTYPNGPDRADVISRRYRLSGVPETVIVDREGLIVPLRTRGSIELGRPKITGPIVPDGAFAPDDLRSLLDELALGGDGDA